MVQVIKNPGGEGGGPPPSQFGPDSGHFLRQIPYGNGRKGIDLGVSSGRGGGSPPVFFYWFSARVLFFCTSENYGKSKKLYCVVAVAARRRRDFFRFITRLQQILCVF